LAERSEGHVAVSGRSFQHALALVVTVSTGIVFLANMPEITEAHATPIVANPAHPVCRINAHIDMSSASIQRILHKLRYYLRQ
jgi:hypothetical protein